MAGPTWTEKELARERAEAAERQRLADAAQARRRARTSFINGADFWLTTAAAVVVLVAIWQGWIRF